jgi:DNA-binding transcriptional regulator LsrR (DeoR family)
VRIISHNSKSANVSGTLKLATNADIVLVGIGAFRKGSTLSNTRILTKTQTRALPKKGAVGDIALRFFDGNGARIKTALDSRIIGLGIDVIRKTPRVIGIAGGTGKTEVIRAAIQGKLINVLITDDQVALGLLRDK